MSGEPFSPCNGGLEWFTSRFCDQCAKHSGRGSGSDDFCPILFSIMSEDESSPDYPTEWIYRNGQPTCTAYQPKTWQAVESIRDDKTIDMFQE